MAKAGLGLDPTHDPNILTDAIGRYFAGELHAIDNFAVQTGGTTVSARVWGALRKIRMRHDGFLCHNRAANRQGQLRFARLASPTAQIRWVWWSLPPRDRR